MFKNCFMNGVRVAAVLGGLVAPSIGLAESVLGTTSGIYTDPNPSAPPVVTTGVGTSHFTWGRGTSGSAPNSLWYTPVASIATSTETDFQLGTVKYFNGTTATGTATSAVDLQITLNLTDPGAVSQVFTFTFDLYSTPNSGSPEAQADYVYLPTTFPTTTFDAGGLTYTLELLGFRNASSNGFVGSVNPYTFHVYEGKEASAELWGRVTTNFPPIGAVPEPASIISGAMAGLLGLACLARRRAAARA